MKKPTKELILIRPRGFCFGVENALKVVEEALNKYPNKRIFVYNEIVHNKTIINHLKEKGISFTQDIENVPKDAVIIFSAHGVSPKVRQHFEKKANIIMDATCPKVTQVHREIIKAVKNGYHIIYIGSPTHDEGRGTIAEAPDQISVVENKDHIAQIKRGCEKYIILTQTTLNMKKVQELHQHIKKLIPQVEFPLKNDLCPATTERQIAVEQMGKGCDLILVIGSQNSSNSQKLKEIAQTVCKKAYLIDNYQEIQKSWLTETMKIGITAGASAPEHLIKNTVEFLKTLGFVENSQNAC